jgi:hypothetical protein
VSTRKEWRSEAKSDPAGVVKVLRKRSGFENLETALQSGLLGRWGGSPVSGQELGFVAVVRASPLGGWARVSVRVGSDDGGFVHGRQGNSATKPTERPAAAGAARQPISRRAPEGETAVSDRSRRGAAVSSSETAVAPSVRDRLVLREVNERIAELAGGWSETGVGLFVCECSDQGCAEAVEITAAEYARIRADHSHFVVFPGHERPESERVVERRGRFVVVANRELDGAREGR